MKLPRKVAVAKVISGRYLETAGSDRNNSCEVGSSHGYTLNRPDNWDKRFGGVDVISLDNGETVTLVSSGQQSTPQPGWTLMLTAEKPGVGYEWTLYGLPSK